MWWRQCRGIARGGQFPAGAESGRRARDKTPAMLNGWFCVTVWAPALLVGLATAAVASAQANQPAQYDAELEKAISLYSEGKPEEAGSLLVRLTEGHPDRKAGFYWLAHVRYHMKQWAAAREAYSTYCRLAPDDVDGPLGMARSYVHEGNRHLAEHWYKRALDIAPSNTQVQQELDRLKRGEPGLFEDDLRTTPNQPEQKPEKTEAERDVGFWHSGLAGLCGARKVWWGRLVAVLIFAFMTISGVFQTGIMHKKLYGEYASAVAFFGYLLGGTFSYILYWGLPLGGWWALLIAYSFVGGLASAAVAQQS